MSEPITIVSGLPRTGTSLMMQILERAGVAPVTDALRAPDADNPRGYFEDARVMTLGREAAWLSEAAPGRALKVVAVHLQHLPESASYRVIYMRRNLDEVMASQQAMLARLGKTGANLPPDALRRGLEQADASAQRLVAAKGWDSLVVHHDKLLGDPETEVARVLGFIRSAADPAGVAACVDSTLHRQRSSRDDHDASGPSI